MSDTGRIGRVSSVEPARRDSLGMPRVRSRRRGPSIPALLCALGLLGGGTVALGLLGGEPDRTSSILPVAPATIAADARVVPAPAIALVRHELALLDPSTTGGFAPAPFGRSAPLRGWLDGNAEPQVVEAAREAEREAAQEQSATNTASLEAALSEPAQEPVREVPLPAARPASATRPAATQPRQPKSRVASASATAIAPPSDGRTLLERMFGAPAVPASNPALAYATPGTTGSGFFGDRSNVSAGNGTAVYNIAKHTVTLPDGTQLEAHSGLGVHLDDPNSVAERMRGATPTTIYELTLRETPFHGVRALRLTPLLEGTTFGRGGLLAHTFMLGPRGDSNGCVVFRNYPAFLAAYDTGRIRRLLVVAGT